MADIKLLDCTLRDGGYVNSWQWGFGQARRIIQTLTRAGVDVVEVGFLRNVDGYDPDVTVCNTIEELNRLLPDESQRGRTMYSGMAMRSNYDIEKLSPYDGHGIEIIRITAHDYDIKDGMDFARRIKELGYKVSINPINIMGYSDKDLLWIFEQVNAIHPWQFSIVDTFGSMRRRDLERIVSMADHNLAPDIRLALHLHENMALSFCLAQEFLDKHLRRDLAVDGSLMGMGRIPGNLPIELIADYMNEYFGSHYNIDDLMDAIQDHIAPIKGECAWGYTPAYFLSAKFNLHRNYAEHYLGKGDLTNRDINHILADIAPDKKTVFDAAYADALYTEYKNRRTDDTAALAALRAAFAGKTVLVLAPGASLAAEAGRAAVAAADADVTISANFVPDFVAYPRRERDVPASPELCRGLRRAEYVMTFLTEPVVPLNFCDTVNDIMDHLKNWDDMAGEEYDLSESVKKAETLLNICDMFYKKQMDPEKKNHLILKLARILVPLDFTSGNIYTNEPAKAIDAMPSLSLIRQLVSSDTDENKKMSIKVALRRHVNYVNDSLNQAQELLGEVI